MHRKNKKLYDNILSSIFQGILLHFYTIYYFIIYYLYWWVKNAIMAFFWQTESVTNLRKAQALYNSRQQDRDRARELALKADGDKQEKRRKAEEEMMHKVK